METPMATTSSKDKAVIFTPRISKRLAETELEDTSDTEGVMTTDQGGPDKSKTGFFISKSVKS